MFSSFQASVPAGFAEFNIVADVRPNDFGGNNLYHNGHKFWKRYTGTHRSGWICSKNKNDCKATVSTVINNGVCMMKILHAKHNHRPTAK